MAEEEHITNETSQFREEVENVETEAKVKKSGIGFFGWLVVLLLVVLGALGLAIPRLDQDTNWGQRLASLPVIGQFVGGSDGGAVPTSGNENASTETETEAEDAASSSESDTADAGSSSEVVENGDVQTSSGGESSEADVAANATDDAEDTSAVSDDAEENGESDVANSEAAEEIANEEGVTDEASEGETAEVDAETLADSESEIEAEVDDQMASIENANSEIEAKNAELESQIQELQAQLESANELGSQSEANATKAAQASAVSALGLAALSGTSLEDGVEALKSANVDIPSALQGDLENIPSEIELENEFGGYAMEAIRASKAAGQGDGIFSGLRKVVSAEFASRSLTPQEGMTPDAVLSRAEDALRKGNLEASLSEISVLPSEAQEAMKPWVDQANDRLDVLTAINELASGVISN